MNLMEILKNGGVAVIPTDTIYGIVGSALNKKTVARIYKLRKRSKDKPFIILISSFNDLNHWNIQLTKKQKEFLRKNWPNPLSVILPVDNEKFDYLHRGSKTLAFRVPKNEKLLDLLKQVGPLVAPSANFEGGMPAETIEEAKKYFGDDVDFYVDGGVVRANPSTLIELNKKGKVRVLRESQFQL